MNSKFSKEIKQLIVEGNGHFDKKGRIKCTGISFNMTTGVITLLVKHNGKLIPVVEFDPGGGGNKATTITLQDIDLRLSVKLH